MELQPSIAARTNDAAVVKDPKLFRVFTVTVNNRSSSQKYRFYNIIIAFVFELFRSTPPITLSRL
jgi:hypothetical protein